LVFHARHQLAIGAAAYRPGAVPSRARHPHAVERLGGTAVEASAASSSLTASA